MEQDRRFIEFKGPLFTFSGCQQKAAEPWNYELRAAVAGCGLIGLPTHRCGFGRSTPNERPPQEGREPAGVRARRADTAVRVAPRDVSQVLGLSGSSSLMIRRISSNATPNNDCVLFAGNRQSRVLGMNVAFR
jgi:hypothetical protein